MCGRVVQANDVALQAPYLSAGAVLTQSDMVTVLARRVAQEFRRAHPILVKKLPFRGPALRSIMLWHKRFADQKAHGWLRDMIVTVAAQL